ncbi:MAG: hypothetical protein ACLU1W_03155 [Collinsella sp.]
MENKLLLAANELIGDAISRASHQATARLELLEQVSCLHSGIPINEYRSTTGYPETTDVDASVAVALHSALLDCGIPFGMALSAVARIEMDEVKTKRNGSVYTDFRLAGYLASSVMGHYTGGPLIDPSCGTSIILAACAEEYAARNGSASTFAASNLYGVDLSEVAIRGSILVVASFLETCDQLKQLIAHFACMDSLQVGTGMAARFGLDGFAAVVGNPPWERVRPSRNEYAREQGVIVDYGQAIEQLPDGYEAHRRQSQMTSAALASMYGLKGGMDLYRAFLNLSIGICTNGGLVALYLPAGLIRSKSLAAVRDGLLDGFGAVLISVFMNHARFFPIDTRFKFVLALLSGHEEARANCVDVRYCSGTDDGVSVDSAVCLRKAFFCDRSGTLGAPEVRNDKEMSVLETAWNHGARMAEHGIFADVSPAREFDMTLDRDLFAQRGGDGMLPLLEGRMVSQFRCGCKAYLGGSGRSAKWEAVPPGSSRIEPQFYIDGEALDDTLRARCARSRVGFCDIAGQTNERAMQAALIPAGCACGNKVPTLLFGDADHALLWLGIVNSFAFDWIVRRYITTTINFFILENLPFPVIVEGDSLYQEIVSSSRRIRALENGDEGWDADGLWAYACERAKLDALVFGAYGLKAESLDVIIDDFPLVDQVNRRHFNDARPTIDLLRWRIGGDERAYGRAHDACLGGAMPYVPNEHARSLIR